MTDSSKITRLSELPRDVPPPRDGWPALEARLRESEALPASARSASDAARGWRDRTWWRATASAASHRRSAGRIAAVAAAVAAIGAGILIDRMILQARHPTVRGELSVGNVPRGTSSRGGASLSGSSGTGLPANFVTDPRYLAERAALLASLDARLKSLPPQTRRQVLASLETIHRSMQEIQQALGREPGNALLQGLLIDTYQDEMRVLTAVQEANAGGGET